LLLNYTGCDGMLFRCKRTHRSLQEGIDADPSTRDASDQDADLELESCSDLTDGDTDDDSDGGGDSSDDDSESDGAEQPARGGAAARGTKTRVQAVAQRNKYLTDFKAKCKAFKDDVWKCMWTEKVSPALPGTPYPAGHPLPCRAPPTLPGTPQFTLSGIRCVPPSEPRVRCHAHTGSIRDRIADAVHATNSSSSARCLGKISRATT
jgi:hypothetical protein